MHLMLRISTGSLTSFLLFQVGPFKACPRRPKTCNPLAKVRPGDRSSGEPFKELRALTTSKPS